MTESNQDEGRGAQRRLARFMVYGVWIVVLIMLSFAFNNYLDRQRNPNRELRAQVDQHSVEVVLQRNRFGHYHASGQINGQDVEFMLDTGATQVAIPESVARRLGLERGVALTVNTANGPATAYATRLASVRLGPIELREVRAHISPGLQGDEILLGMSVLRHLDLMQRGDQLTLRQARPNP